MRGGECWKPVSKLFPHGAASKLCIIEVGVFHQPEDSTTGGTHLCVGRRTSAQISVQRAGRLERVLGGEGTLPLVCSRLDLWCWVSGGPRHVGQLQRVLPGRDGLLDPRHPLLEVRFSSTRHVRRFEPCASIGGSNPSSLCLLLVCFGHGTCNSGSCSWSACVCACGGVCPFRVAFRVLPFLLTPATTLPSSKWTRSSCLSPGLTATDTTDDKFLLSAPLSLSLPTRDETRDSLTFTKSGTPNLSLLCAGPRPQAYASTMFLPSEECSYIFRCACVCGIVCLSSSSFPRQEHPSYTRALRRAAKNVVLVKSNERCVIAL